MLLKKKIIVVTGGVGLIGEEFVKSIIENGGTAIVADINENKSSLINNELSKKLPLKKIDYFKLDVTSKKSLQECIQYIHSKYGKIDALINNAYPRNKNYGKKFFDVEYEDFVENLGINLGGVFISSRIFAKYFKKQGFGNIINIASIYGVIAPKFEIYKKTRMTMPIEYAAIKSGVLHLTKYLAKYLKGNKIRVNAISPGGILNDQPKSFVNQYNKKCSSKGMLDARDLTGTLIFLLSDKSDYINGQNIVVDDGFIL
jgi:NAD(P)-dependent dehydrogenase (short-subunit alcohol dehydrogenase family)